MKALLGAGGSVAGLFIFYVVSVVLGLIWAFKASVVVTLVGLVFTGGAVIALEFWCKLLAHFDLVAAIAHALGNLP